MMPDHYATLGVPSTAKTAAIRAAYLALLREYHPDRNPDPAANLRAQAVIAAFKVLGDFDQRNHYDWDRRREREAAEAAAAKRPPRIRTGPIAVGAIGLAAVGALVLMPTPSPGPQRVDRPIAEVRTAPVAKAEPSLAPSRVRVASPIEKPVKTPVRAAKPEARAKPIRVASIEPVRPKPAKAEPAPIRVRSVAVKAKAPRVVATPVSPPPPILAAARPAARRATTDLASLDQFV
ncbi:MAG TPA: DnaJ domain-containing protein, partial [Sphingomicrobium sp.]|nr:DnaJ domain-containing protein [Sphingomicrobium sp.]